MLFVPVQCLGKTFLYISFAQSRKILSKFLKLSAILKHGGKNFVMMTSIVHLRLLQVTGTNENTGLQEVLDYSNLFQSFRINTLDQACSFGKRKTEGFSGTTEHDHLFQENKGNLMKKKEQ